MTPTTVALAAFLIGAAAGMSLQDVALTSISFWFAAWLGTRARG